MNITVNREYKFDAAHFLPDFVGDCAKIHGHTWIVALSITGPIIALESSAAEKGMVISMDAMKNFLKVAAPFDHDVLNNFVKYPTTERVLEHITLELKNFEEDCLPVGCFISRVSLCEQPLTPRFWAEVSFTGRGFTQAATTTQDVQAEAFPPLEGQS